MANNLKKSIFLGTHLKITRANQHRNELIKVLEAYGSRLTTTWVEVENDPDNLQLTFSEPAPPEIPLIIGDTVHNLRSALDLLVNEVAQSRGANIDTARLQFPYAKTEADYLKKITTNFSSFGQDLQNALLNLRVFEGGDKFLSGLHNLDICDKHRYVMPLMSCSWGKSANDIFQESLARQGVRVAFISWGDNNIFAKPSLNVEGEILSKALMGENELVPYRANRATTALFADGMPFARQHVLDVLDKLTVATITVVDGFSNRFA